MPQPAKRASEESDKSSGSTTRSAEQSQLDFELEFYTVLLHRHPDFVEVLRAQANNLTIKGRHAEGLEIDKKLIQLRPKDPLAHYNLACSLALLKKPEAAIDSLCRAVELGYRDFRYMSKDKDLDSIRNDPRFRQLVREFSAKKR